MIQNVWIWNHYATNMFFDQAGRHYWFAENLIKEGYKPTIFCASTNHFSDNHIDTNEKQYSTDSVNDIPFVFVNTPEYKGNGKKRVLNMISFYRGLFKTAKMYAELNGKPDVILASSVHPLTLVAGIKIAKKFDIPCICEIRDLWPESIVAYGSLKRNSLIAKLLYQGEKWIYKKADRIIFTMEGGKDYIVDKKWNSLSCGPINIKKVFYLNNGVDLDQFNKNKANHSIKDLDLSSDKFKVIYTGSIRAVNDVEYLVEIAKQLKILHEKDVELLIYGDGPERERLVHKCKEENLENIKFKGRVPKQNIPFILSKANLNILHFQQNSIKKYGASLNKLFEYFASGKPVMSDCEFGYDLIKRYKCGFVIDKSSPENLAKEIINIKELDSLEYETLCNNSLRASIEYDYKNLTGQLIKIINMED